MHSFLLALSTAVPRYRYDQERLADFMTSVLSLDAAEAAKLRKLYKNSAIKTRYSVLEDFSRPREDWTFWGDSFPHAVPGMTARNAAYKNEAHPLALEASRKALAEWGGSLDAITHLISASCTGVVVPGIEFELLNSLKLNRSVNRLGINFMGCFGAFKALAVAHAFAKENSKNRILLVCTELCSLHMQGGKTIDTLLANALFADGAAAAVVGGDVESWENSLWEIVKNQSMGLENSFEEMSWEASDTGFLMTLSQHVPQSIRNNIVAFSGSLLQGAPSSTLAAADCDWAIHPGGKAIVKSIEEALNLKEDQTIPSWNTLANYGNMSSATFLFVLDELRRSKSMKEWSAGLGFGPGLSMEGILLRKGTG